VSADGLPLAAYPPGEEAGATEVWARLSSLGQVARGFVTMRSEVWAFVQAERYGALVLADRTVRPGQVLELVDQVLAQAASAAVISGGVDRRSETAEGSGSAGQRDQRDQRERGAAVRGLRTPLHREEREPEPDLELEPATVEAAVAQVGGEEPTAVPVEIEAGSEGEAVSAGTDGTDAEVAEPAPETNRIAAGAVDIIALAREFAGLLSERDDG
jgi:hypothetical protein